MNFWQAIVWEASPDPGDQERLERALERFNAIGISFVRILASTQASSSPFSIKPAIQSGAVGEEIQSARILRRLLDRLSKYGIQAIVVLGNFWSWSGGFPAYSEWAGRRPFPVIGPDSGFFQMARFFIRAARVYSDPEVNRRYQNLVRAILEEVPSGHEAIFSFQLANEPTPFFNSGHLQDWTAEQTELIRSKCRHVPITLGGIGEGPLAFGTKTDLGEIHSRCGFDFVTAHIWPENWGWFDPKRPRQTFEATLRKTRSYLVRHAEIAQSLGVPLLLEEINLARDFKRLDPGSPTGYRDRYLSFVQGELLDLSQRGFPIAGIAYWTWETDPPHEPMGWYGIRPEDHSTIELIKKFSSPT